MAMTKTDCSLKTQFLHFGAIFILSLCWINVLPQSMLYDINVIQKLEIEFSQANWDYQLDTAKTGSNCYIMADWIKVNGVQFDSVGVKYKGNSSYDSTYVKNPLHIALDEFKNQSLEGYTDIKLSNGHSDPSMIREVLAYGILSEYLDCPAANFAQVYINGTYIGLYTNTESITREFCSDHFYSSDGTFIKASPVDPGPYSRSNLKYISADSSDYFHLYEIKSVYGWNDLVSLCDALTNLTVDMDSLFDIDRILWMLAFNNIIVNLDSYSGAFAQNYYLYKDQHQQYNAVVWDLNMCFGGFPFAGMQGGGMGSLTIADMQNLPVSLHFNDSDWALIKNTMSNSRFKKIYHAHLRTIAEDLVASGGYADRAQSFQVLVDTAVQSDTNRFFSYEDFLGGLDTDVPFGSYVIPGISNLMEARLDYLEATDEFNYSRPLISEVGPDNANPGLNSEVFINALVTDTDESTVLLFYRFAVSENFVPKQMFDDGLNHDGAADDGIYGASVLMSSEWLDYFIYAENSLAAALAPAKAEHEYFSLKADVVTIDPGDVVINEFLAINQTDTTDEDGQHEDWIELFNKTNLPKDLYGLYLSDDYTNPAKFAFPVNTVIEPKGFLVVWADEDSATSSFLHSNFRLAGTGEDILLSDIDGNIFDSLSFGPQVADVSMGRCPDGNGTFEVMENTTFNTWNCEIGIPESPVSGEDIIIYPNPVATFLTLKNTKSFAVEYEIFNVLCELCSAGRFQEETRLNVGNWNPGLYYVIINKSTAFKIVIADEQ